MDLNLPLLSFTSTLSSLCPCPAVAAFDLVKSAKMGVSVHTRGIAEIVRKPE